MLGFGVFNPIRIGEKEEGGERRNAGTCFQRASSIGTWRVKNLSLHYLQAHYWMKISRSF